MKWVLQDATLYMRQPSLWTLSVSAVSSLIMWSNLPEEGGNEIKYRILSQTAKIFAEGL